MNNEFNEFNEYYECLRPLTSKYLCFKEDYANYIEEVAHKITMLKNFKIRKEFRNGSKIKY